MQEDHQKSPAPYSKWRLFGTVSFITVKWIIYFGIFFGLLGAGAVTGYVAALVKDEEIRPQSVIQSKVGEYSMTGYVYFNDDSLVGQLRTDEDRIVVTYEEIPTSVINALLATEDNNFMDHNGVDIYGLGRAVKQKLFNEDTQTGGSTLTQQLARRVFLSLDKTDSRKIKEIFLSLRMERYLIKEEILAAYLNKMPFGNGSNGYQVFGIKAAAKGIFGITDLQKLNIAQSAYLAGLPQLPSLYTAFTGSGKFNEPGFERAVKRQQLVLSRMLETKRITKQEYDEALNFDIRSTIAPSSKKAYTTFPYLMLEAERQAAEALLMQEDPSLTKEELRKKENANLIEEAREQLLRGGYHVYTTIDKDVYSIMRKIGSNEDNFAPYSQEKGIEQIAGIILDHKTGAIIGMLEGRDFYEEQMNFATQMIRQPGSTMKTLAAYLPAIEKGTIGPASIIDDAPLILKDGQKGYHIPMNVNRKFAGLVTARDALNRSMNLPALKIFNEDVTIAGAWDFVRQLGITTLQPEDAYSQTGVIGGLRLGVSVEEMTNAYGAIPNQGVFQDAYMIQKITDANGKIIFEHKPEPKRVFSEQTAFLMTDMLKTVISSPTGSGNAVSKQFNQYGKIPVAGKTGSTQSYGDVWFMGYTPDVTLGVWAGYEEQINALSNNGRTRARSIWTQIMNELTKSKPELFPTKQFAKPDGIVKASVSSASGLLPSSLTREAGMVVTDWFNKKYLPKKQDDALVNMKLITYEGINYVPNALTPSDMLKEKIVVKRKKPLDELMDEIKAAQSRLSGKNRRPMEIYIPADAENAAPSKTDPRVDDGAAPAPPNDVKLQSTPGGDITITFSDSKSADVVGYRLYSALDKAPYTKLGESVLLGDEYKKSFKASDKVFTTYYVVAVDVVGKESAPSTIVNFGTKPTTPEVPEIPEIPGIPGLPGGNDGETGNENGNGNEGGEELKVPSAPTGIQIEGSELSVLISWSANPVSDKVFQYHIYYSPTNENSFTKVGTTTETSFEHPTPFATGTYYVVAENSAGMSSNSPKITRSE
ncbi:transglycosylase domain-containing protein [Paenibacillus sp. GSMTC-2017]|uniref:transglycosylase domain-containing protein n=1 Tax=Paenibacillus sp. GSMTC-2017 TaxID=2794350 RepID=UPI0018D9331B|nr:transglycosylase domain-containing protein [Paenibacillus sp. GSMTC-2017]MBH5316794.1 transglycosylase domain-containing protein [Paenibacillus sp. GSMTC-2017]